MSQRDEPRRTSALRAEIVVRVLESEIGEVPLNETCAACGTACGKTARLMRKKDQGQAVVEDAVRYDLQVRCGNCGALATDPEPVDIGYAAAR